MQIHTDTHVHNSRDWRTVERNSNREGFRIVSSRKQTKSVFTNRKKPSWVAAAAQQQRQQTQQRPRRRLVSVHSLLSLSLCVVATHCRSAVAALFAAPSASFFKCCSFCCCFVLLSLPSPSFEVFTYCVWIIVGFLFPSFDFLAASVVFVAVIVASLYLS